MVKNQHGGKMLSAFLKPWIEQCLLARFYLKGSHCLNL